MIFLSKWVICRFQPLIFQGVQDPFFPLRCLCFTHKDWHLIFEATPPLHFPEAAQRPVLVRDISNRQISTCFGSSPFWGFPKMMVPQNGW